MMLMGAMMGALIGSIAHNSMAGLMGAVVAGGALGLFHGWVSRQDQGRPKNPGGRVGGRGGGRGRWGFFPGPVPKKKQRHPNSPGPGCFVSLEFGGGPSRGT